MLQHGETVYRAAVSDCGSRAITTAGDGVARVWHLMEPGNPSREIGSQYRSTRSCDVSSDGKFAAATFYTGKKAPVSKFQGTVVLYDADHDAELFRTSIAGVPDKVRVSQDASIVAVGCYGITPARIMARDTCLTLFHRTGEILYSFPRCIPEEDACMAWDLSDDGRCVAICAEGRSMIALYSVEAPEQWASPPRILRAHAPLVYEMVRIVDNGDLITTLALDKITRERSVLVFRPSSGDVLFSLACGLKDSKACVDLEPRVCYVTGTYERAERKVVRLLSRTGGDNASLKLVRCGDPPKKVFNDASMKATLPPPVLSVGRMSPSLRSGETGTTSPPSGPRLLVDSPTPAMPQPARLSLATPQLTNSSPSKLLRMNSSPTRLERMNISTELANVEPVGSAILPNEDQFALSKPKGGDTTMVVDAHTKAPAPREASPTLSTSNLSPEISPIQRISELPERESSWKASNGVNEEPAQSAQIASRCTSVATRALEVPNAFNQAPENTLTTLRSKSRSSELIRAKMEKLMCKSTTAAKIAQQNTSPLINAVKTGNGKEYSITERGGASQSNEGNRPSPQSTNIGDDVTDEQEHVPITEAANLNKPGSQSNATEIVDENNDPGKTDNSTNPEGNSTNPQSTHPIVEMREALIAQTSNLKKPRWQRMINKDSAGNEGECEVGGIQSAKRTANMSEGNPSSPAKTEDIADGDTSRVNGILRNGCSARPGEASAVASWQQSAAPPGVQGVIHLDTLRYNNAARPHSLANTTGNSSLNESNASPKSASPSADNEAKTENALTCPSVDSVPQPSPIASCKATEEVNTTYRVKEEDNHMYKNRYFHALEGAKTLFRQASHEVGGEQVVSNVKGFKAMMELLQAHNEPIDQRTVARIVYEKGGIRDALDETLFLEAFSVLYGEVQAVRQRLWSEVYDQASAEEEGLLVFHARDLVTRECESLKVQLNPVWNIETLEEVITSYSTDGVLVDRNAFVQAADHIFSI